MAFKDNFRIEKIYFQRVKDDAQILGSWKNDPRRYSREEIVRVAKDACDSILMLYRLIGESWNDALNQIEKLSAELDALAAKTDAYHDELNEKIDEVNNYLNTQIKNLEIRVENIENSIEDFGGLPSNENAEEGDVLTVGENHVNEWRTLAKGLPHYYFGLKYNENNSHDYVNDVDIDATYGEARIYKGELIDNVFILSPVHDIGESDILTDYFAGKCLVSAYVKDYSDEDYIITYCAPIVKAFNDDDEGEGSIAFNLTSPNHHHGTIATGSNYVAALLLTLQIGDIDHIYWETYIGTGTPILELMN